MERPVEYLGHCGRHRHQILDAQTTQDIETLLQIARLVEIHQGAGQGLAHPYGEHGRGVGPAGDGDVDSAGHDRDSVTLATAWKLVAQARDTL